MFLGVATIAVIGVAALVERSVVRGFPYFRGFVVRDGLHRILYPSFIVMSYVVASITALACVTLGGSSPSMVGLSSETGVSSTLPWMKKISGKKELGVMLCAPTISFQGGVVIGRAPTVMQVSGAHASLSWVV